MVCSCPDAGETALLGSLGSSCCIARASAGSKNRCILSLLVPQAQLTHTHMTHKCTYTRKHMCTLTHRYTHILAYIHTCIQLSLTLALDLPLHVVKINFSHLQIPLGLAPSMPGMGSLGNTPRTLECHEKPEQHWGLVVSCSSWGHQGSEWLVPGLSL